MLLNIANLKITYGIIIIITFYCNESFECILSLKWKIFACCEWMIWMIRKDTENPISATICNCDM